MRNNLNQNEYEQKSGDYTVARNKKFDWIILVLCVFLAFVIWAYALNINDPIIEKELFIVYTFESVERSDVQVEFDKVLVYGPASLLEGMRTLEVKVTLADLYNKTEIDKRIKYPDRISPVDNDHKTVNIKLINAD